VSPIFITFGVRNAFMTTGYETPKCRRDEVESTYGLSFGISQPVVLIASRSPKAMKMVAGATEPRRPGS